MNDQFEIKNSDLEYIVTEILKLKSTLQSYYWDVYIEPNVHPYSTAQQEYLESQNRDKETYILYGTRRLYYCICVFLELKNVPSYLKMFVDKFNTIIEDKEEVVKGIGPLYEDSDPSMKILDHFDDFLNTFPEFDYGNKKNKTEDKLHELLKETNNILIKTKTKVSNETSIYKSVKWFIELIYPSTRNLNTARFIRKFSTYHPDILIPEISTAIEYKFIKKSENVNKYLDQLKTDADNYIKDVEYNFFYAVVYYEDKTELTQSSFIHAVKEKHFPSNWIIIGL
jgi:hypothetical protein